jgi:carbamoyl-phosphate synthase small subunit
MGKTEASGDAVLALADGRVFRGRAFGAVGEASGELVFNTSMTGYQEILTDPSYEGQLVAMTYPEIGHVGVNREDGEARRPFVRSFVVRDIADASSWRAEQSPARTSHWDIPGIRASTRALVRHCAITVRRAPSSRASSRTPTGWCARRRTRPGWSGATW